MKRAAVFTLVVMLAATAAGLALAAKRAATQSGPELRRGQEVPICHATRAESNPYVRMFPDVDGILSGHDDHDDDIIPPFEYEPKPGSGESGSYIGKNWDAKGQQIWAFDCDPSAVRDVTPRVECVEDRPNTGLFAHFGYRNSETSVVKIEVGRGNLFAPDPANRGQPITFEPGTHGIIPVPFTGSLTWRLAGRSATASSASTPCDASIRIDKTLTPETDPGRFDLLLNGEELAADVGNGGTTYTRNIRAVPAGTPYTVAERAASTETNLADYSTTIVCRDNGGSGGIVAQGTAASLPVTVRTGQAIVCVVSNVRGGASGPGSVDLAIVKKASPQSVFVGEPVTWTVTVTNKGPDTATNVVIDDKLPDDVSFVDGSLKVPANVTCTGARCTIPSLVRNASVTGTFVTTATNAGTKTNTVTVDADQTDVNPADNAASAQVLVTSGDEAVVAPVLECVGQLSSGLYRAHFGYLNRGSSTVGVPVGPRNAFTPVPENRGQPVRFQPGRAPDVFQVDFRGTLVWTLTGRTETASASSRRCETTGWLRIDKILRPADDPGRFNLEIDGVPAGSGRGVGHQGTTGDVAVPAGRHRVGEEGVDGTSLADYDTTIACRDNRGRGPVRSAFDGPELVVDVAEEQEVVCTIENTRRTGQPVPPNPTPPGPTPPPLPQPLTADLSVRKFVSARVADLGDVVEWTVIVTNNGPETATGVTVTDDAAARATIVSLEVSQGTCGRTTCSLGTIPPGGSVRIVARTRTLRVGAQLNTVIVGGQQPDSIPENNAASALIHIVSSFTPPLQRRCGRMSVDRRVTRAGATVAVSAVVRNVFGKPLAGTRVSARGAGQLTSARTNADGVATFQLAPSRPGIVRFTVGARTLTAVGARLCTARMGVLGATAGGLAPGVISVTG